MSSRAVGHTKAPRRSGAPRPRLVHSIARPPAAAITTQPGPRPPNDMIEAMEDIYRQGAVLMQALYDSRNE